METCRNNLQTSLQAQIEVAERRTASNWSSKVNMQKRLSPGLRQKRIDPDPKRRRGARQKYLFNQKGRIHWQQRRSLPLNLNQPEGWFFKSAARQQVVLLQREARRFIVQVTQQEQQIKTSKEVDKTDNPNYCLYHRMLGHPTKSCYIFKDIL